MNKYLFLINLNFGKFVVFALGINECSRQNLTKSQHRWRYEGVAPLQQTINRIKPLLIYKII